MDRAPNHIQQPAKQVRGHFFRGERYPTHGKKSTVAPAENHKCVGVKEGTLGNMGSEGVREIMGGHFGKYGIRRSTGNNGTGPNYLHKSLFPTEATSSTPTSQDEHLYSTSPTEHLPSQRYQADISPPDHNHTMRRCTIGTKEISQILAYKTCPSD